MPPTKEQTFHDKIRALGLTTVIRERSREQYGVTQYRLEIRIFRDQKEIEFTTGGYWGLDTYRESGFEQGLRRLHLIKERLAK